MMPLSKSAMLEATRLTREGKLTEAMAVLQGSAPVPAQNDHDGPTIDLTPGSQGLHNRSQSSFADGLGHDASAIAGRVGSMLKKLAPKLGGLGSLGGAMAHANTPTAPLPEGARFLDRTHSASAGARDYKLYVPSGREGQALPLVVMLHGCTQSPDDFAAGTRMNELAEAHGFLVAYPAQDNRANAQRCWNWFQPADQSRGAGEPAIVASLAKEIAREFAVPKGQVFVAGLSAGGALAAILAVEYPDVFAAAGIHSGLPAGAAHDMPSAFAAMRTGGTASAAAIAIPAIVFHGDRDATVHPSNGERLLVQAGARSAVSTQVRNGTSASGASFERTVRRDAAGRLRSEHWLLHGAGHAWSGGSPAGTYTDAAGPDASAEMVRFFLEATSPATASEDADVLAGG
ncbi:PHB depolymerase family esterase [Aureimonas sp. AU12]|uniref:extracellular catalytic domain type 1 short-chain-length polyhydroxyalkanoate depolymerase n=1 Tax=Aureimonas sp. AU12 TaxID=1638161 RepID=UPI0007835CA6|nr:PHB depolymerase family esterase [Aureimonas sp. AU12]